MKRSLRWLMSALLICGLWIFVACANDDNPVVEPDTEQLQDGVWTGSGDGRNGTIIVKVTIENHQMTKVTVVSQSESSFAQETINNICKSAVGRTGEMSVEVDGITGATLTSTGVIDAINMALEVAMGKHVDKGNIYQGGTAIGPHLMKILKSATSNKNIEIRTSNKVTGLLSAVDGSVKGVMIENANGSTYTLTAKAVIIATGGFGANLEMVTSLQPSLKGFATLNHPGATGDAFGWMTDIGGATIQMANIQIHPTAEATNHILITEAVRGNGAILVNQESKRFCNEMDTRDVVSAAILKQTQGEAFLIFDQGVRKSLAAIETYANQHLLKEGNTIAELAETIEIPAADLEATLNRYNTQQKTGVDEDFGRSAAQMTASLETAPYYAVCVTPSIHHTMGGLSVNTDTQVLKADDTPIPGLYAAGEVTGGLHGANRLGGNGVADIVVNGRLAGISAAQKVKDLK